MNPYNPFWANKYCRDNIEKLHEINVADDVRVLNNARSYLSGKEKGWKLTTSGKKN